MVWGAGRAGEETAATPAGTGKRSVGLSQEPRHLGSFLVKSPAPCALPAEVTSPFPNLGLFSEKGLGGSVGGASEYPCPLSDLWQKLFF